MLLAIVVVALILTAGLMADTPAPVRYHVVRNPGGAGAALLIELTHRGAAGWRLVAMSDETLVFVEP
jgi:hypothetical protein